MTDVVSALQTPLPLQRTPSSLPFEDVQWIQFVGAKDPALIVAYCFDFLLDLLSPQDEVHAMDSFQRFCSVKRDPFSSLTADVMRKFLHPLFCQAWCLETSWGSEIPFWTPEAPATAQQTVTALFLQECFGGQVLSKSAAGSSAFLWNRLPNKTELDLTRDQPVSIRLDTLAPTKLKREMLLSQPEIKACFSLFRLRMIRGLIAYGKAAASLAYQQGWKIPPDRWDVG